jgi:ribosomal protein S6
MKYEICYLVGESKEADLDRIKKEVEEIVSGEGGIFEGIETMEKRKLAYQVKHDIRGTYIARRFEIPERESEAGEITNSIAEATKKLNLYGDVLRFIFVKADELPELKQREARVLPRRDERRQGERGRGGRPPMSLRPRMEVRVAPEKKDVSAQEKPASEEKPENIDKKLDELLNI